MIHRSIYIPHGYTKPDTSDYSFQIRKVHEPIPYHCPTGGLVYSAAPRVWMRNYTGLGMWVTGLYEHFYSFGKVPKNVVVGDSGQTGRH